MLGKEGFGEFSIVQSTILTLGVFAGFGTGLTSTKHIAETFRNAPERSGKILALTTLFAVTFGIAMFILLVVGAPFIASRILSSPQLTTLLQIASISLIASALNGAQFGALAGFEEFRMLSRVNLLSGITNVIAVTIGVFWNNISGAVWGYTIATLISCFLGARAIQVTCISNHIAIDYRNCLQERQVLWKFSLPSMLANTLVMPAIWICNAMLVNQPGGIGEMATYNIVTQWRQIMLFLPGVAAQVFLPIMTSESHLAGSSNIKSQYLKINLLITVPILLISSVLSPFILAIYGANYVSQWPVFVVVQLATLAQIVQSPVVTSWTSEGKMWTNLGANIFWGLSLVIFSKLLIDHGALGLGMALFISFMIYFIVIYIISLTEVRRNAATN